MPEPVPWLLLSTLPFAPGAVASGKRFTAPTGLVVVGPPRANAPAGPASAARAKTVSARVRARVVRVFMCGCSGGRVNEALKCRLRNARRHATLVLTRLVLWAYDAHTEEPTSRNASRALGLGDGRGVRQAFDARGPQRR